METISTTMAERLEQLFFGNGAAFLLESVRNGYAVPEHRVLFGNMTDFFSDALAGLEALEQKEVVVDFGRKGKAFRFVSEAFISINPKISREEMKAKLVEYRAWVRDLSWVHCQVPETNIEELKKFFSQMCWDDH